MASPFSVPGAKLTLVVALAMTMLGFVGVSSSISALTSNVDDLVRPDPAASAEVAQAAEAGEALMRAFLTWPLRRAKAVANLLASGLLLIASFMLTGRARSAPWWAAQALWANAIYTLAECAIIVHFVVAHRLELVHAVVTAQAAQGDPVPAEGAEGLPLLIVAFMIFMHAVFAGLYVLLLRVTRREDVRRFVAREV